MSSRYSIYTWSITHLLSIDPKFRGTSKSPAPFLPPSLPTHARQHRSYPSTLTTPFFNLLHSSNCWSFSFWNGCFGLFWVQKVHSTTLNILSPSDLEVYGISARQQPTIGDFVFGFPQESDKRIRRRVCAQNQSGEKRVNQM